MAAFFREALVLNMNAGDSGSLVFAYGAHGVEFVAIAGVGVGDNRETDRRGDAAAIRDHLRHRDEPEIGIAQGRGRTRAGHVDRFEAGPFDEPRRDAVIGARRDDHTVSPQESAKPRRLGHSSPPAFDLTWHAKGSFHRIERPLCPSRPGFGRENPRKENLWIPGWARGDDLRGSTKMGWLHRLRFRRAAKRYAQHLGPHLARAYGPSEFYSPGQIRAAVAKTGLNPKFIVLGYAAFLPDNEFGANASAVPVSMTYQDARDLVRRFQRPRLFQAPNYYESGVGLVGGSEPSGHGDGGSH